MRLLAIDPGVQWCGAAMFSMESKRLFEARRFRGEGFKGDLNKLIDLAYEIAAWTRGLFPSMGTLRLVFEWPQVYAGRQRGRKDPNDLLPLAGLNVAIASELRAQTEGVFLYQPHDWKGSKQANPTARSIIARLEPEERQWVEDLEAFLSALNRAETAGKDVEHPAHNTLDAVGVGLKHLGRFERKRIIAR